MILQITEKRCVFQESKNKAPEQPGVKKIRLIKGQQTGRTEARSPSKQLINLTNYIMLKFKPRFYPITSEETPMKWLGIALICASILGCNQDEIKTLQKDNEGLKSEVKSLKSSLESQALQLKRAEVIDQRMAFLAQQMKDIKARLITNVGQIELKFYADKAPIHVFNFITRAESGFYNGTKFHRVIPGFMIQGGDPNSKDDDPADDGGGGPIVQIPHEFNETHHVPGVLSMARVSDVSAGAGCQFFIMHGNAEFLDRQYTAFGEVTKGQDIVDKIATSAINPAIKDRPAKNVIITRIEIYK
ncbi:MAG: peptidylprolyl isomerase [bacterium]|nr:peptidylprolyl isomerase [bacterium]